MSVDNQIKCFYCDKFFKSKNSRTCHMRWHDLPQYKEYQRKQIERMKKVTPPLNIMIGDKNPMWKGDDVGNLALHDWVKRNKVKPDHCESCKELNPKLDLANISQEYKRDLDDWEWLCRRCHMTKDGRMKQLRQYQK